MSYWTRPRVLRHPYGPGGLRRACDPLSIRHRRTGTRPRCVPDPAAQCHNRTLGTRAGGECGFSDVFGSFGPTRPAAAVECGLMPHPPPPIKGGGAGRRAVRGRRSCRFEDAQRARIVLYAVEGLAVTVIAANWTRWTLAYLAAWDVHHANRFDRVESTTRSIHLPVPASWPNQTKLYFSIAQRKAPTPNDRCPVCQRRLPP